MLLCILPLIAMRFSCDTQDGRKSSKKAYTCGGLFVHKKKVFGETNEGQKAPEERDRRDDDTFQGCLVSDKPLYSAS